MCRLCNSWLAGCAGSLEQQTEFNLNLIPPKLAELRSYVDEMFTKMRCDADTIGNNIIYQLNSTFGTRTDFVRIMKQALLDLQQLTCCVLCVEC